MLLFDCDIHAEIRKENGKILTNFPVAVADIVMSESSPPLMINELFVELVTHSTPAVCSLENLSEKMSVSLSVCVCWGLMGTVNNIKFTLIKSASVNRHKIFPFARYSLSRLFVFFARKGKYHLPL